MAVTSEFQWPRIKLRFQFRTDPIIRLRVKLPGRLFDLSSMCDKCVSQAAYKRFESRARIAAFAAYWSRNEGSEMWFASSCIDRVERYKCRTVCSYSRRPS